MLLRVLPEQLDKFWPFVKYGIEHTLHESAATGEVLNNILEAILLDKMQVWIYVVGEDSIVAMVVTAIFKDDALGNVLRIYCLYGFATIPQNAWAAGWSTLVKYAKANECKLVEALTPSEEVLALAKKMGFSADYHVHRSI